MSDPNETPEQRYRRRLRLRMAAEHVVGLPERWQFPHRRRVRARDLVIPLGVTLSEAISLLQDLERHGVVTEPWGVTATRGVRVDRVPASIPRPRKPPTT